MRLPVRFDGRLNLVHISRVGGADAPHPIQECLGRLTFGSMAALRLAG
jgi:hypothetical protein